MTQDLRQLINRGIPILTELAAMYKVPEAAVFELAEEGKLSAEIIEAPSSGWPPPAGRSIS